MKKILVLLVMGSLFVGANVSQADLNPGASLTLHSVASLNSSSDLGVDITPLGEQSGVDNRILKWTWAAVSNNPFISATVGIDLFNNYSAHNFVFWIYGATDYLSRSGNVGCVPANSYSGRFDVRCFAPYNFVLGHTYRIKVLNDAAKGPTWWYATLDDLQSGSHVEIGDLNSGPVDNTSPLASLEADLGVSSSAVDCSQSPVVDTIYSNFISGDQLLPLSRTTVGNNSCALVVPNRGKLGGFVFKVGGADPKSRNLEGAPPVATDTPVLDPSSRTGIGAVGNVTNLATPVINVTGILAGASVHVTAQDPSGNSASCDIPANLVVSGSGNCALPALQSGVWSVSDTQTLGGVISDVSSALQLSVDRTPIEISIKAISASDGSALQSVVSNKSGVGYLANSALDFTSANSLESASSQEVKKFPYVTPGGLVTPDLSNLLPGKYRYYFEDLAGNLQMDTSDIFHVLPPAPNLPQFGGQQTIQNQVSTNNSSPTLVVKGLMGPAQITATSTSGVQIACLTQVGGVIDTGQCRLATLADGTWTISAKQTLNSETSISSQALTLIVDTLRPVFTFKFSSRSKGLDVSLSKRALVFAVPVRVIPRTAQDISQKGFSLMAGTQPKSGTFHLRLANLKSGSYRLCAVDNVGNFAIGTGQISLNP